MPSSRVFATAVADPASPGNAYIFGGRFATSTVGNKVNCKAGQDLYNVRFNTCGDGLVGTGAGGTGFNDVCDDGNNGERDGCSASCYVEEGWNCTSPAWAGTKIEGGADASLSVCTPVCGDGMLVDWPAGGQGKPLSLSLSLPLSLSLSLSLSLPLSL